MFEHKTSGTVAVIGAMEQEIELLKSSMENVQTEYFGKFTVHSGFLNGKRVALALSGIGKANAAAVTALVVGKYSPDYVINTGSAGGVGSGLKVGDVVIGTRVAHHDVDVTAFGYVPGQIPQMPAEFESDGELVAKAAVAADAFEGADVHKGLIVSGDQFIHSSEKVDFIRRNFNNVLAVEMEAAAIAQICFQLDMPFVTVRAVSDAADEQAEISFDEFLKTASVNSARMVMNLI
ncbi:MULTISPECIES: 5'-methylthioadenosine/adenosylhomocysteine nucleosidase [Neisseria]|uniref:5'-methylthioadenosine/S-adenosylhomocysteine nucleosidase n=1 Tax=Neisseria dumasiana TaxID=1931275 RepID=A0ABX3WPF7_9NEIS|nr:MULTISPECIES: 5'-methylthioadenosine/adenosylhomocysteine nucleosidase [Neisseria]KPN74251.1 5'-methylthioadenosine nucleosidase [Neisseria sp. 74A18]OSI16823.1 5'-methylthioadenosine/S-adenosylhomocysteine nucleosidase [Neisseria dumasiana]OSI37131.1 5'-methylthioadenosine/S-adenosylhomocysteine nucleosidase [Neisseria dumasiana]UOO83672.1 5'-methylthioadenosine/adenosylhomocysteine nucleosidase [Neisseria dumasiana]